MVFGVAKASLFPCNIIAHVGLLRESLPSKHQAAAAGVAGRDVDPNMSPATQNPWPLADYCWNIAQIPMPRAPAVPRMHGLRLVLDWTEDLQRCSWRRSTRPTSCLVELSACSNCRGLSSCSSLPWPCARHKRRKQKMPRAGRLLCDFCHRGNSSHCFPF